MAKGIFPIVVPDLFAVDRALWERGGGTLYLVMKIKVVMKWRICEGSSSQWR